MSTNLDDSHSAATAEPQTWQLNAVTEALGDLSLTVSDSLSIGRGSDNDVVLGSKEVSRNHAQLSVLNGQLYVKDLGSSNGTFINNERVEDNHSKNLKDADSVSFASFAFQVAAPIAAALTTEPTVSASVTDSDNRVLPEVTESPNERVIEAATLTESMIEPTQAPVIEAPVTPVIEEAVLETAATEPAATEPVVKTTLIEEVLASESANHSESATVAAEPTASEPPLVTDAVPTIAAAHTSDAHDKTTKTALQEQADPEVLRAKQAATGQFSGTANLDPAKDIGTEGNNALDQALNNPANAGQIEKKPSGSWFIWLFVIIIIIALALWLFNVGAG